MRRWMAGMGLAVVLAAGCGGDGGDEDTAAGGDDPAPTTEAETTTTEEETTTTTEPPGGIDCLVGEMELVAVESSATLLGEELSRSEFSGLDDIHVAWEIRTDAVVAPVTGKPAPLTFPLADDGAGPTVTLGTMVLLPEAGEPGEVTIGTFGGALFEVVQPGSEGGIDLPDQDVYALLLPLDEPATVTCPDGGDVTIEGPTTTTTLRPVDPPELTPVLEQILAGG